ncbi:MAG: XkdX family protein [Epulopiscium sp.]|nr:XkdX family protein [Candidatus Epulonipiscium sp.]
MSRKFEKWKIRYEMNFATKEQLQRLIPLTIITELEYEEITGDRFND